MAKATFTAERSRQFDILQAKEVTFLSVDGCSERASELFIPGYQLKPSGRSKLNWSIKEHRGMNGRKIECHFEIFEGTQFHTLSVQWAYFEAGRKICPQIKCAEAKLTY